LPRVASPEPASGSPVVPQPVAAIAAIRTAQAPASPRNCTLGGRSRAEGSLERRVNRKDAVEAGDLKDLRDVPVAADE
jgi:hypothetical protein